MQGFGGGQGERGEFLPATTRQDDLFLIDRQVAKKDHSMITGSFRQKVRRNVCIQTKIFMKKVESRCWLDVDFRNFPEKKGLPKGWQDTSKIFGTKADFRIMKEKGAVFLRLETKTSGKVQIRLPLKKKFNRETSFCVTFLGRSSTNAGVLMGVRALAQPEQGDEVEAAVLLGLNPAWKEHTVTTRGGPVKGAAAFYFNFGAPGTVDILFIKVEEIPSKEHVPVPTIGRGHEDVWEGGWLETHEGMRTRAWKEKPEIGYWGDSITAGWVGAGKSVWDREFSSLKIQNFGIGGDTVDTVLWRIRDAKVGEKFSPKLVVLMIGINNLFRIHSPVDIADGMAVLLKEFRTRLPKSRILLFGVLPARYKATEGLRKRIAELNRRYKKLADGKTVIFTEVGRSIIEPDGSISQKTSGDGTHLLEEGYERLVRAVGPKIQGMIR